MYIHCMVHELCMLFCSGVHDNTKCREIKKNQQFAISLVNDNLALFSDAYRQKRSEFDI